MATEAPAAIGPQLPDWILAIDFGTSFTTAAIAENGVARLVEMDGAWRVPSLVLRAEDGSLVVGRSAQRQALMYPDRVELTPKRYIGERAPLILGGGPVRIEDAVGAVMRAVLDEAQRLQGNRPPKEVRLTHPASWQQERLSSLADAAARAGIARPVLIPEPVGAAVHFARDGLKVGDLVAVYDLGGGTFDTAVLRRTDTGFELVGRPGGLDRTGGEGFDQRLYRHLGEIIAREDEAAWFSLRGSSDLAWRRANADFLGEVRAAKEALSRDQTYALFVGPPLDRRLQVSRTELERLIEADIDLTVEEFARTIDEAGVAPADLSGIYLAGGSSRIPLVARRVAERFGRQPDVLDEPKAVIALGAALADGLGTPWASTESPAPPRVPPAPQSPPRTTPSDTGARPNAGAASSDAAPPGPRRSYTLANIRLAGTIEGPGEAARPASLIAAATAGVAALFALLALARPFVGGADSRSLWRLGSDHPGLRLFAVVAPLLALVLAACWFGALLLRASRAGQALPILVAAAGALCLGPALAAGLLWTDTPAGRGLWLSAAASLIVLAAGIAGRVVTHAAGFDGAARAISLVVPGAVCATGGGLLVLATFLDWFADTDAGVRTGFEAGPGRVALLMGGLLVAGGLVLIAAVPDARDGRAPLLVGALTVLAAAGSGVVLAVWALGPPLADLTGALADGSGGVSVGIGVLLGAAGAIAALAAGVWTVVASTTRAG